MAPMIVALRWSGEKSGAAAQTACGRTADRLQRLFQMECAKLQLQDRRYRLPDPAMRTTIDMPFAPCVTPSQRHHPS
jgi:hypothetical protein